MAFEIDDSVVARVLGKVVGFDEGTGTYSVRLKGVRKTFSGVPEGRLTLAPLPVLEDCCFCNTDENLSDVVESGFHRVVCSSCLMSGPRRTSVGGAYLAWNRILKVLE